MSKERNAIILLSGGLDSTTALATAISAGFETYALSFRLQEKLKYCSPLGPALRDIRKFSGGGVGVETIRKLEGAGITDLVTLNKLGFSGLRSLGVRKDIAKRIVGYLRRRLA